MISAAAIPALKYRSLTCSLSCSALNCSSQLRASFSASNCFSFIINSSDCRVFSISRRSFFSSNSSPILVSSIFKRYNVFKSSIANCFSFDPSSSVFRLSICAIISSSNKSLMFFFILALLSKI